MQLIINIIGFTIAFLFWVGIILIMIEIIKNAYKKTDNIELPKAIRDCLD